MKRLLLFILILLMTNVISAQHPYQDLADADGQFADVDGVSIYYIARGDNANPAVILIHGFGGSTFTWRDNMDALVDAGFYVVALDLPPFGLSDKSPELDYSQVGLAGYAIGLLDELGIETASFVGHSMGGAVVSQIAAYYPERVDNLVFVAGVVYSRHAVNTTERGEDSPMAFLRGIDPTAPLAANLLRLTLTPERFNGMLSSAYYRQEVITDATITGYTRPLQTEDWMFGFLAYIQADNSEAALLEDIQLAVPILVMWGEQDTWVPIEIGETITVTLPNVTMITYADVGHLPMEENTAQFNADLVAFLFGN